MTDPHQNTSTPKLFIGIDFGTAYSSIAIYLDKNSDAERSNASLLTPLNLKDDILDNSQIATEMAWNDNEKVWVWGDDVERSIENCDIEESDRITMLKLALAEMNVVQGVHEKQLGRLPEEAKAPDMEAVIIKYLKRLYEHAKDRIRASMDHEVRGEDVFEVAIVKCILSVPALWSQSTKDSMKEVAIAAGIPDPLLVSEPEAAAMYMQHEHKKAHEVPFVVVDVGGGTGDLITYLPRTSSTPMRELVKGTGGAHGSAILNELFRAFFQRRYAHHMQDLASDLHEKQDEEGHKRIIDRVVRRFEVSKRSYDGQSQSGVQGGLAITLDGIQARPGTVIGRNHIRIPREDVGKLFKKIIDPIAQLIEGQIKAFNEKSESSNEKGQVQKVRDVLFVGGLCRNKHVAQSLEAWFKDETRVGYPIKFHTPNRNSNALISKGAILCALYPDRIGQRILRCSLGFVRDEVYDPILHADIRDERIHRNKAVRRDRYEKRYMAKDRVKWLFKIDKAVSLGEVAELDGAVKTNPDKACHFTVNLFRSRRRLPDHARIDDKADVDSVEELTVNVTAKELANFSRYQDTDGGLLYRYFEYKVRLTHNITTVDYEVIIPRNGRFDPDGCPPEGTNPIHKEAKLIRLASNSIPSIRGKSPGLSSVPVSGGDIIVPGVNGASETPAKPNMRPSGSDQVEAVTARKNTDNSHADQDDVMDLDAAE